MNLILQTIQKNWKEVLDKTCVEKLYMHGWKVKKKSAGLDIPCPMSITIPPGQKAFKIHLGVRVEPDQHFWLVPRSSFSKKHLTMSNKLIDQDYRGELIMVVDNVKASAVNVLKGERLCQIVPLTGSTISFSFGKVKMNTV